MLELMAQGLGQGKVDSLNVSVAAGLLCEAFLRKPDKRRENVVDAPFDADTRTAGQSPWCEGSDREPSVLRFHSRYLINL